MPGDWRGPSMPGQLPLRVAILGGIGIVAFAIVFLRLWYLEVLSGDKYLAQAQNNQVREFTVQAPRGKILDRHGNVLVENRTALALQVKPLELPKSKERRADLFARLGDISDLRPEQIRTAIRTEQKLCAACPATLRRDVPFDTVYYLRENQAQFPGVSVERVFVRRYPQGQLAAHILGYTGEVSTEDLEDPAFEGLQAGDQVGQVGVEGSIRHPHPRRRRRQPSPGRRGRRADRGILSERDPVPGNDLVLSIDDRVQTAGESGIAQLRPARWLRRNERAASSTASGPARASTPRSSPSPCFPSRRYCRRSRRADLGTPSSTARPRASIPPARSSSRSLRWRLWTRASSGSTRSSMTTAPLTSATVRFFITPVTRSTDRSRSSGRSRSRPTSSSTRSVSASTRMRATAARFSSGRARLALASPPDSTSGARARDAYRLQISETRPTRRIPRRLALRRGGLPGQGWRSRTRSGRSATT